MRLILGRFFGAVPNHSFDVRRAHPVFSDQPFANLNSLLNGLFPSVPLGVRGGMTLDFDLYILQGLAKAVVFAAQPGAEPVNHNFPVG